MSEFASDLGFMILGIDNWKARSLDVSDHRTSLKSLKRDTIHNIPS
jgi:hypothetical protein